MNSSETLIILLDSNQNSWQNFVPDSLVINFDEILDAITIVINMHLSLNPDNRVVLYAFDGVSKELIFPLEDIPEDEVNTKKCRFDLLNLDILRRINDLVLKKAEKDKSPHSKLAGVLSKSLCYLDQKSFLNASLSARILIVYKSRHSPKDYHHLMNAVLAAAKKGIVIDSVLVLGPKKDIEDDLLSKTANMLKQASYLTKGIYLEFTPEKKKGIIQNFTQALLIDTKSREKLIMPNIKSLELEAACHCHATMLTKGKGYVCSVCLRLFCEETKKSILDGRCKFCHTRFDII